MQARYVIAGLTVVVVAAVAMGILSGDTEASNETLDLSSTTTPAPTSTSVAPTSTPPTTAVDATGACTPVAQPHVRVTGWFPDISSSNEATGLIDGTIVVGNAVFLQFPEAGGPAVMTVNAFVQGDPDAEIRSGTIDGIARALGVPGEGSLSYDAATGTVDGVIPLSISTFPTGGLPPDPSPEPAPISVRIDITAGTADGTIDHPDTSLEVAGTIEFVDANVFSSLECYQSIRE